MSGITEAELESITPGELDMLERQYLRSRSVSGMPEYELLARAAADIHDEGDEDPSDELLFRKLPALLASARSLSASAAEVERLKAENARLEDLAADIMRNINERDECPFCGMDGWGDEEQHDPEALCGRLDTALSADSAAGRANGASVQGDTKTCPTCLGERYDCTRAPCDTCFGGGIVPATPPATDPDAMDLRGWNPGGNMAPGGVLP